MFFISNFKSLKKYVLKRIIPVTHFDQNMEKSGVWFQKLLYGFSWKKKCEKIHLATWSVFAAGFCGWPLLNMSLTFKTCSVRCAVLLHYFPFFTSFHFNSADPLCTRLQIPETIGLFPKSVRVHGQKNRVNATSVEWRAKIWCVLSIQARPKSSPVQIQLQPIWGPFWTDKGSSKKKCSANESS